MVDEHQIRRYLADWLAGRISLSQFEDWFVPATWNIQGSENLVNFVDEIELNLSEYSGGYLSKQQLRSAMLSAQREFAPVHTIVLGSVSRQMTVRSSSAGFQNWPILRFREV
jgi:hypothetical protein